ncbi:MAG: DUF2088 domain-containing protein [Anaerolineae bacterium]|nr:DUF2088 domain-containing protein [Anaerolineae bacterium]
MIQLLEQTQSLNFPAQLSDTLLVIEQQFETTKVMDVPLATHQALENSGLLQQMKAGASVAIGVGSRGIVDLPVIVRTAVEQLKAEGLQPFIVPAMGSHGGATAEGQTAILAQLGITAETVRAEVRATMEVKEVGRIPGGPPLYQDIHSLAADHTLLINRVKPHTSFRSHIESGLAKMAVIGLGKQRGADEMHSMGVEGLQRYIAPAARLYEILTNLVGGLAIVENAYHQTAAITGLTASEIGADRESGLLRRAKSLMASLPFPEIDVLVVRQMGKNISGTGMDTNVIGRLRIPRQSDNFGGPDIAVITVLDLTEATHGNCTGLGLAEVTTARVLEQIDWGAYYTNALTSGILNISRANLPLVMPSDQKAIQAAIRGCGQPQAKARVVYIQDTLTLDRLWVSPSLRPLVEANPRLTLIEEVPLSFDANGMMASPWEMV